MVSGGKFCRPHTCIVSGCLGERIREYCNDHTCFVCGKEAGRKFYGHPVCEKHYGICVECCEREARKNSERCLICERLHQSEENTNAMMDYLGKIGFVATESKKNGRRGNQTI